MRPGGRSIAHSLVRCAFSSWYQNRSNQRGTISDPLGEQPTRRGSEHAQLGAALREARRGADLTQRQLARRLNRPISHVGKIESRERRPCINDFPSYARALGKEPATFLTTVRAATCHPKRERPHVLIPLFLTCRSLAMTYPLSAPIP
ncbi:helix-turn-helix transcriptional regulator [Steroidobacter sp.]|uniref:helix-turn-helix domain-containing protein n=1 Tax=Steroidobacter sp. TaxID=1978227 RepID=UPI0032C23AB0